MISISFDINDEKLRQTFFDNLFIDCIARLDENALPLWGKMTSQHMVEHLVWTFECSTGTLILPCHTPENLLERVKKFLYYNRPTPHEFKNPLLSVDPPTFRFSSFIAAKAALHKELNHFISHFREQPAAIHVHPVFGPLRADEWQRSNFKHCYHHLLQFGLINQLKSASS